jgi:TonB family protein
VKIDIRMVATVAVFISILSVFQPCSAVAQKAAASPIENGPASASQMESAAGAGIIAGRLLHDSPPKYPKDARKHKVEGIVDLRLTIGEHGSVVRATAVSGDPGLTVAAEESVRKRKYEPFLQDGKPVESEITTAMYFALTAVGPVVFAIDDPEEEREFAKILKLGNGVTAPHVVYAPDPAYTDEARRDKLQGVSVLALIVDEDGHPRYMMPVRRLGDGLDENAVTTMKSWRFQPATKDGTPVPVLVTVEVAFHLY